MTPEEFSRAFKDSPMKRAKLRGRKHNAALVLGSVGTSADLDVLTRALGDAEPLAREHAAWALGRLGGRPAGLRVARAIGCRSGSGDSAPARRPRAK